MPFERVVVNDRGLDLFVRYRLGQRVFQHEGTKQDHLRLDFDAQDDNSHNDSILSIFHDLFDKFNVKVILRSHKGGIAYVILNIHEEIDSIEHCWNWDNYECGQGTCWWLIKILKEIVTHNESNESSVCDACRGSGTSYWSDDIYGACLDCCCIDCKKFNWDCKCVKCKKCFELAEGDHICTLEKTLES